MAVEVLTNARVEINGVNLSNRCVQVEVDDGVNLKTANAMGDTGQRLIPGISPWTMRFRFLQDTASSQVEATLSAIRKQQVAVKVRVRDAAIAATNPEWQGNGMMPNYKPISGQFDDAHTIDVEFRGSDGLALVRATS